MISPSDKAASLVKSFYDTMKNKACYVIGGFDSEEDYEETMDAAKECAIISVEEILNAVDGWDAEREAEFNESGGITEYWNSVRECLNKM